MDLEPLLKLIRQFEGCKLVPYICPAGVLTCGWGSTGPGVIPGRIWTQHEADNRLILDAASFYRQTQSLCPELNNVQLCAIADFAYNLGVGRLKGSTLLKRIRAGAYEDVPDELRKWVLGGGKKLPGLVKRREAEIALFEGA